MSIIADFSTTAFHPAGGNSFLSANDGDRCIGSPIIIFPDISAIRFFVLSLETLRYFKLSSIHDVREILESYRGRSDLSLELA